jgi:hypothetical protein
VQFYEFGRKSTKKKGGNMRAVKKKQSLRPKGVNLDGVYGVEESV